MCMLRSLQISRNFLSSSCIIFHPVPALSRGLSVTTNIILALGCAFCMLLSQLVMAGMGGPLLATASTSFSCPVGLVLRDAEQGQFGDRSEAVLAPTWGLNSPPCFALAASLALLCEPCGPGFYAILPGFTNATTPGVIDNGGCRPW